MYVAADLIFLDNLFKFKLVLEQYHHSKVPSEPCFASLTFSSLQRIIQPWTHTYLGDAFSFPVKALSDAQLYPNHLETLLSLFTLLLLLRSKDERFNLTLVLCRSFHKSSVMMVMSWADGMVSCLTCPASIIQSPRLINNGHYLKSCDYGHKSDPRECYHHYYYFFFAY